jgi:pimeloyl-ACP methyl ester carboxylesterase
MSASTPTIVLVHGAFADASGWSAVHEELAGEGLTVRLPPNPLRSLIRDSDYIRSFVEQIDGPVLLVGHSYGGAVITVAGAAENVVGLVYVAAFAPDEGENLGELQERFPDSDAKPTFRFTPFPGDGVEVSLDVETFPVIFAHDVPAETAAFMAISQRPLSAEAFGEAVPVAAWRTKPSWAVFPTADGAINPEVHRYSYQRAGSDVVVVEGASHSVALSHPDIVADTIRRAVASVAATAEAVH